MVLVSTFSFRRRFIAGIVFSAVALVTLVAGGGTLQASVGQDDVQSGQDHEIDSGNPVMLKFAELSGVAGFYRYRYGVDPITNVDLRDSVRTAEGTRAVVTLLFLTTVAPIVVALLVVRKLGGKSAKPATN